MRNENRRGFNMTNYGFIKQLLKAMAEEKAFCVKVLSLNEKLAQAFPDMDADDFNNEFYKNLCLLKDCGAIEEMAGHTLGFRVDTSGNIRYVECVIRLTATGYGFYDSLCKNGFVAKIKNLSLSAAMEFSKAFIAKSVEFLL